MPVTVDETFETLGVVSLAGLGIAGVQYEI